MEVELTWLWDVGNLKDVLGSEAGQHLVSLSSRSSSSKGSTSPSSFASSRKAFWALKKLSQPSYFHRPQSTRFCLKAEDESSWAMMPTHCEASARSGCSAIGVPTCAWMRAGRPCCVFLLYLLFFRFSWGSHQPPLPPAQLGRARGGRGV